MRKEERYKALVLTVSSVLQKAITVSAGPNIQLYRIDGVLDSASKSRRV